MWLDDYRNPDPSRYLDGQIPFCSIQDSETPSGKLLKAGREHLQQQDGLQPEMFYNKMLCCRFRMCARFLIQRIGR